MIFFLPAFRSTWRASWNFVCGVVGEPGDRDVADRSAGEVLGDDLLRDDDVADDLDVDRFRLVANDRQDDLGALLAADLVARAVDGQAIERSAVDRDDRVTGLDARLLRRRALDRGHDDQEAVGPERRAVRRLALAVARPDLGADPLELAGQVLQPLAVLLGGEVGRVGIAERVDHALDRAVDQALLGLAAEGEPLDDRVVAVPERLERRLGRGRRAGLLDAALADEEARDEQGAAGEDRHDDHREGEDRAAGGGP